MCDQLSLRPACAYAQSVQRLCYSLEYSMTVKLLPEHYLEFLSLTRTRGCTNWSETTLVKIPHSWKSHVATQLLNHESTIMIIRRVEPEGWGQGSRPPPDKSKVAVDFLRNTGTDPHWEAIRPLVPAQLLNHESTMKITIMGGSRVGGGKGFRPNLKKSQVDICFQRNTGTDPHREAIGPHVAAQLLNDWINNENTKHWQIQGEGAV